MRRTKEMAPPVARSLVALLGVALFGMALLGVAGGCRLLDDLTHTTPPHIVARHPSGEVVRPFDEVEVVFSAPMGRAITERAFGMEIDGLEIEGTFRWRSDARGLRFVPDSNQMPGDRVRMYIRQSAEDRWGNSLRREYADEFMVNAIGPAPQLERHSPKNNEAAVAPRRALELHFSQPIDPVSLYAGFDIVPDTQGSFVWSRDYRSVRFVPLADYRPDRLYRVSLEGRLRTQDGVVASIDEQFAFVTAAQPVAEVASITITNRVGDAAVPIALSATDVLALNEVGAERQIDIGIRFTTAIVDGQRARILGVAPAVPFDLTWLADGFELRATPLVPLEWNRMYELTLLDRRYRFIVDGAHSRPPVMVEALFAADRSSPEGFRTVQEAANIPFPDSADAALRLYFELAADATIDLASFGESLRIEAATGIFEFVVRDIEIGVSPAGRPFAQALLRVVRNGTPPDIVTLSLDEQLHDSRGNRLRAPIQISVNGL